MAGVCAAAAAASGPKDYSVPLVSIEATVRADGSVLYEEHRTYRFDGSFSEADYILRRDGFEQIRDIHVREGDHPYLLDDSREPGTYRIREHRRSIEIVWRYEATDEERTFTISYVLEGAIARGREHAEFFWTYLSDRWERPTDSLVVNLIFEEAGRSTAWHGQALPDSLAAGVDPRATWADEVHSFMRGASHRVEVAPSENGIRITGSGFRQNESLAVRSIFPASLVPDAEVTHPELTLALVQAQEEQRVQEALEAAERRERRAALWRIIGPLVFVVSILAQLLMYLRYGRPPELGQRLPVEVHEPPSDLRPAVAGAVVTLHGIGSHSLVATLFDLCRQGLFRLIEQEPEKGYFGSESIDYQIELGPTVPAELSLRDWELDVCDLITQRLDSGKKTVSEVFNLEESEDLEESDGEEWFSNWHDKVKLDVDAVNWYRPDANRAMVINLLIQIPLTALGALTLAFAGVIGLLPLLGAGCMALLTPMVRGRTPDGEREYRLWQAYRRALRRGDLDRLADAMSVHFPFAVAMSIGSKRLEQLVKRGAPEDFFWLSSTSGRPIAVAHLAHSVSTVSSSIGSTVAAGTGVSAGSPGGGAGGGAR